MKKVFLLIVLSVVLVACTSKHDKAIQYNKAGIKKMFTSDLKEALEYFNLAIELEPTFDQPYFYRANIKYSRGNYQGAMTDYNKAIELNPGFADAYFNRGNLYQALNDFNNACADWQKAHDLGKPNLSDKLRRCN